MKSEICDKIIWPEAFVTGRLDYQNTEEGKLIAINDAYIAWANANIGCGIPEYFGLVMAAVSEFLGIPATPENLEILLNQIRDL